MSRRARANRTIGGKINSIANQVAMEAKSVGRPLTTSTVGTGELAVNAVTNEAIEPDAVTDVSLNGGSVTTDGMGVTNIIQADYNLELIVGDGGHVVLDGDQYPLPTTGNTTYLAYDSSGYVVPGGAPTGGGGVTVVDATTTTKGIVQLATLAEVQAGTDSAKAVTSSSVAAIAATKANLNQTYVAIDTDGVPYFAPGLDFTNAVPLYADTDGVPYLAYTVPTGP